MRPLVISHRACVGHAPENTLEGIRTAIELGAEAIEIDVQASSDGVPVLMHDFTVDRTTGGEGAVADLTLDQLRGLKAGAEPVRTLVEALDTTKGKVLLVMEIKQPGIEEQISSVVSGAEAVGDVMCWSFIPNALEGMRTADPRIPCALLISPEGVGSWPAMRERALSIGAQGVSIFFLGIDERITEDCRRSGLALYAWTADQPEQIAKLIAQGVDGICSNYPDRVVTALANA